MGEFHAWTIVCTLFIGAISGCLMSIDEGREDASTGSDDDCGTLCEETVRPYNWSGCLSVQVSVLFDIGRARAHLPPGYEPTDGGHLAGHNPGVAPTGKANLDVTTWICDHVDGGDGPAKWTFSYIDVQPPRTGNVSTPSPHPAYDVLHATSSPNLRNHLQAVGLTVVEAEVNIEVEQVGPIGIGRAQIKADGAILLDLEVSAASVITGQGTIASWHQREEGATLTVLTGTEPFQVGIGRPILCTFGDGSILAELTGSTECVASASKAHIMVAPAIEGTLTFMPGLQAER